MSDMEEQREWEARIAEFRASGMSGAGWCKEHGLNVRQFYYWITKLEKANQKPQGPAQWLRVEVGGHDAPADMVEVRIGKAVVEVRAGFDPELLAKVVQTLALC